MLQNLAWGAGYNLFAIPLAAGVLAFAGYHPLPRRRRRAHERLDHRRGPQRSLLRHVDLSVSCRSA